MSIFKRLSLRNRKPIAGGEYLNDAKTIEFYEYGFVIEGFLKDNEGVKAIIPFEHLPQPLKEKIIECLKSKQ